MEAPPNSFQASTRAQWRRWLSKHHKRAEGVWLITFKKRSGGPHVEYGACVEEALCFGWIDSLPRKLDEQRSMLWFAPRKPGTGWSRLNKERVERLLELGALAPAGRAKIRAAQSDGSWGKLDAVERLELPEDLRAALRALPQAAANFEAFPPSAKRGILEWIGAAKRAPTRAARIAETAECAARNERANQWRP